MILLQFVSIQWWAITKIRVHLISRFYSNHENLMLEQCTCFTVYRVANFPIIKYWWKYFVNFQKYRLQNGNHHLQIPSKLSRPFLYYSNDKHANQSINTFINHRNVTVLQKKAVKTTYTPTVKNLRMTEIKHCCLHKNAIQSLKCE